MSDTPIHQASEEAYREHLAEILAIPRDRLIRVNLDVGFAVTRVLGLLKSVEPLREEIRQRLPDFDIGNLDRLAGYARALAYANTRCERRGAMDQQSRNLLAQATQWRARFMADAAVMEKRELIEPGLLKRFSGVRSHLQITDDLSQLAEAFRFHWDKIQGRTAVTLMELAEAEHLTQYLRQTLRLHERHPEARATRQLIRAQAYTLFANAYDEVRRAVTYLRWEGGQCERLVPSLYAERHKRDRAAQAKQQPERKSGIQLIQPQAGSSWDSLSALPNRSTANR